MTAVAVGVVSLIVLAAAGAGANAGDPTGRVAFVAGGKIHVVSASGSGARELGSGGAPSWSPDGRAIAFHSARVPGYGLDIYLMNRDGRFQRRLVSHPTAGGEPSDNTRDDFDPSWSSDGAFVAHDIDEDRQRHARQDDRTHLNAQSRYGSRAGARERRGPPRPR